jgi:DNA-binding transcriptional MocR family regulator
MSLARRQQLVETDHFGVPIVGDDPYGELRYEGQALPTLKSLDRHDSVMYLGTFSKILAPAGGLVLAGRRAGKSCCTANSRQTCTRYGPTDGHVSVARNGFVDEHVKHIIEFYRERRDVMCGRSRNISDAAHYTRPAGGLFVWAELLIHRHARSLARRRAEKWPSFGPGFHSDLSGSNTMRLNFSNVPPDQLREGVRRLGQAIQRRLAVEVPV